MLVGGENMPFIINAQGDQLNRFVFESLDYFSKETDQSDYSLLVRQPTEKHLNWTDDAIDQLFYLTNGHPFYTKLICEEVFNTALKNRDSEIGVREIASAVDKLVDRLDTPSFAHHWMDGIQKNDEETESIILNRRRCLVAMGRCIRNGMALNAETIFKENHFSDLSSPEIKVILNDFTRRQIIKENTSNNFELTVPLFKKWLGHSGIRSLVILDTIGDELAEARIIAEENQIVSSTEIHNLVKKWQAYRGREVTTENVRHWLDQGNNSVKEKKLLFKLLENVRFVTDFEIRQNFIMAHSSIKTQLPEWVQEHKRQRRPDIAVCYIDGEAKSGQRLAALYAEENNIPAKSVLSSNHFSEGINKVEKLHNTSLNSIVVVDDIIATGKSFSDNFEKFLKENYKFISQRSIMVSIVILISTADGERSVTKVINRFKDLNIFFKPIEVLAPKHFAFSDDTTIWETDTDSDIAKALCNRIGSVIQKKAPLGYGGQSLLITFPDRCPNNSLPILYASSNKDPKWDPLFPRAVN